MVTAALAQSAIKAQLESLQRSISELLGCPVRLQVTILPEEVPPVSPVLPARPTALYLSVGEAAEALRVSRSHVYNLVANGTLRAERFGRTLRIPQTELRRVVEVPGTGRS